MHLDFCPKCFTITDGNYCHKCGFNISAYQIENDILPPGTIIYEADKIGTVINKYKIGCKLGRGGFGITYTCQDTRTGKRFAVKEYMPQTISRRNHDGLIVPISANDEKAYKDGLKLFMEEANRLVDFAGQNNIVKLQNFVASNNTGYIIMEYLDGINMKQKLGEVNTMDGATALRVLLEVANCLRDVHAKGIIHGDISPENIMELYDDGTIKLIDFGAAKSYVRNQRDDGTIFLKHGYAPPEQYSRDSQIGKWTDIYALAATYYKLVTGITPPKAIERRERDTLIRLDQGFAGVDKVIADCIAKAMSIDYRTRYMSMDEFVNDLKRTSVGMQTGNVKKSHDTHTTGITSEDGNKRGGRSQIRWPWEFGKSNQPKRNNPRRETHRGGIFGSTRSRDTAKNTPVYKGVNPYIRIIKNGYQIGIYNIRPGDEIVVGRDSAQSGVVVPDEMISRRHCVVKYDVAGNVFAFRDESRNGVFTDTGARLQQNVTYNLKSGTVLILATNIYMELGGNHE